MSILKTNKVRVLLTGFMVALFFAALPHSLQAQTFAPIQAIAFTKPFGGANPLPQTLTVASVGSNFYFGISAVTATGGDWLSVSKTGCCYSTPFTPTVTVNSNAALAVGTYTGQIVFTAQSGSTSITVGVTLTVAAGNTPFFDNLPGQMSFFLKTGGTALTSQNLQIRNGGTGTLNWTLAKTTSDGGNWLSVSAAGGTAPSQISVSISVANLPNGGLIAGSFIGQLLFQSSGGGSVTVPVSVVVGSDIFNQINSISFVKPFGGTNPLPQTLTVASMGTNFYFGISAATATGGNWLSVSKDDCCYSTPYTPTVTINASPTLAVGTYTGQVVFYTQSGSSALTVGVTLTVEPTDTSYFDNIPGQLSFFLKTNGTAITSQQIGVRNGEPAASGALNWTVTATTSDTGPWLTVTPSSGSTPSLVTVGVSVANLPNSGLIPGTFTGQLLFQSSSGSVTVPVSVVVGSDIFNQINSISFVKPFGGANPLSQTLTVASIGTNFYFGISAATATGGNWLSVSKDDCCYSTPYTPTVTINASPTLAVGTYTGQVVFYTQSGSSAVTVGVTLTVEPTDGSANFFDNVPGQMTFSFTPGGAPPPGQTVQIRNGVREPMAWTATSTTSDGGNWLSPSPASGSAPSLLTVNIVASNLPNQGLISGTFTGELVLQTSGSSVTIPVSVTVGDNVFSQANALSFVKYFGGANPLPQTFTVSSTGAAFYFGVTASTANGGEWLSVSKTGCCYDTPNAITATVNASAALAAGTYTGQIHFYSQSGSLSMLVPVTLVVSPTNEFQLVTVAPCRVIDTRTQNAPLGGPFIAGGSTRTIPVPSSACGIPANANAYSLNITVVPRKGTLGYLSVWPAGTSQPLVSTLNSLDGSVLANAAIVPAGTSGSIDAYATDDTDLIVDINGYFVPPAAVSGSLQFYPLPPCRVLDTRGGNDTFGGPGLAAGGSRSFPIPSSPCGAPSSAAAYSFNTTVVPKGQLGYLTAWPTGQPQPLASTLNSLDGTILANAAIVPAGAGGAVSFFASDATDLIVDINGYFAPPAPAGLDFFTVTPCRLVDTRNPNSALGGPIVSAGTTRTFPLPTGNCGLPSSPGAIQAYSLNMTAVPGAPILGYLTTWPTGATQPVVSTLNALKGQVVANAAIVPAGNSGSIDVFVTDTTDVIIDTNGYFAPAP